MSDNDRGIFGPSGRQLAYALAIILLIGLVPLIADRQVASSRGYPAEARISHGEAASPPKPISPNRAGDEKTREKAPENYGQDVIVWLVRAALNPDNFSNFLIMLFTLALTVVGVLEYRLIRRSTKESAAAAATANKAADAALISSKAATASLLADHRPWIEILDLRISGASLHREQNKLNFHGSFKATYRNIGSSPALALWDHAHVEVMDGTDPRPLLKNTMEWVRRQKVDDTILFPGRDGKYETSYSFDGQPLRGECHYIFLFFIVAYGSAFSNERHCTAVARSIGRVDMDTGKRVYTNLADVAHGDGFVISERWLAQSIAD